MIEQRRPATRPDTEWLIRQIRLFFEDKFFLSLQMTPMKADQIDQLSFLETALAEHIAYWATGCEDAKVMRLVKALGRVQVWARVHPWTGMGDAGEYKEGVGLLRDIDAALAAVEEA